MPYSVYEVGSETEPFCVYKVDEDGNRTGNSLGCHPTEKQANKQIAAIEGAEESSAKIDLRSIAFTVAKATEEMKLEVLGAPYGGHINGKDRQNEFFSENTDFQLEVGDRRPVNYYHGFTPDHRPQKTPERVGWATVVRRDEKGLWFEVELDEDKPLAKRLWNKAKKGMVKASTGAIDYLVRKNKQTGELLTWVIGELSLVDKGNRRVPANELAYATPLKAFKATYEEANIPLPEGVLRESASAEDKQNSHGDNYISHRYQYSKGDIEMSKAIENLDLESLLADAAKEGAQSAIEELRAEEEARKAREEKEEELREEIRKEELEKLEKELEEKVPNWKAAFNTKELTDRGNSDDRKASFIHWVRTGDKTPAMKSGIEPFNSKAMEEGVGSEGGFVVPDDFRGEINERRDRSSFVRQAGFQIMQTSRDVLNVPVEDESSSRFTLTAEEGSYNDTDYALAQVAVQVHKFTREVRVSEELMADEAANLDSWLANRFGRALARTENYYVAVGTGSGEPEGIFTGGDTDALTFDSGSTVTASEIPELYGKLDPAYRDEVVWLTHSTTESHIRGLRDANDWAFGPFEMTINGQGQPILMNHPYFLQDDIPELADNAGVIAVGNPEFYAFVERSGLVITRNPYLYEATGQIALFARVRFGGAVLQEEAFKIGVTQA